MTPLFKVLLAVFVASLAGGRVWSANHYSNKYQAEKARADAAEQSLKLANATITDMQTRQRDVAALDAQYNGELQDAKATIDQLERDVATGKRRLQLNSKCVTNGAPGTSGMDDGNGPDLLTPLSGIISPSESESKSSQSN